MAEDQLVEIFPNVKMDPLNFISVTTSPILCNPEITPTKTFLVKHVTNA